jgi:hypothetical protein
VTTGKKGGGFLGDDDLLAELDQWDRTFDALHEADSATLEALVPAKPEADAPTRVDIEAIPDADDVEARPASAGGVETDFSDLAPGAQPEALGPMLGREVERPPRGATTDADDAVGARLGAAPIEDPFHEDVFAQEEEVYTSASRPVPPPSIDRDPDFDDGPARPAAPPTRKRRTTPYGGVGEMEAPTRITSLDEQLLKSSRREQPPPRSSPAVVRRDRTRDDHVTPAGGIPFITDDGATKIASVAELEAHAQQSAQQFFAELDEPPAIELEVDESAYDGLELGDADGDAAAPPRAAAPMPVADVGSGAAGAVAAERRITSHVVRRQTPATRPPPIATADSGPVIEIEAEPDEQIPVSGELPARPVPQADDDLAGLMSASNLSSVDETPRPGRTRPPRPPPGGRARNDSLPHLIDPDAGLARPDPAFARGAADGPALPDIEDVAGLPPPPIADRDARAQTSPTGPASDSMRPLGAPVEPALGVVSARVYVPTSIPPLGATPGAASTLLGVPVPPPLAARAPIPPGTRLDGPEPGLELDAIQLPEQVEPSLDAGDDTAAGQLLIYERELETTDDANAAAALRVESGRLCERLGDPEHARIHYEAALIADPRSTAALRGLRRLARAGAELGEATRHLDAELSIAGGQERRPLALHRVDLLMASGEQDLARVAVGELLDEVPLDVRGLFAHLELAFLDGRADEFGESLARLGDALADPALRAVALVARGHLGERARDKAAAQDAYTAALAADPSAETAALGAARVAAARGDRAAIGGALATLAGNLVETSPATAAAMALHAAARATDPAVKRAAIDRALAARPSSPIVAAAAADHAATARSGDPDADAVACAAAYRHLAGSDARPGVRAFAAAMAAELTPSLVDALPLWQVAVAADTGDDYAIAQLRAAHIAGEDTQAALDFDRRLVAADPSRERVVVRAAYGLAARGEVDDALALIDASGAGAVRSPALIDARADILAAAGRWEERARALAAVADGSGASDRIDKPLALIRAARGWDDAAAAAADPTMNGGSTESATRTAIAALDAWGKVLDEDPIDPEAHGAAIVLAERLGDRDILFDALTRAQAAERLPGRALALALRRARAVLGAEGDGDAGRADEVLKEAANLGSGTPNHGASDPRRLAAVIALAARTGRIADAAIALEDRADVAAEAERKVEAAALRYRAAQLWIAKGDDPARAGQLLSQVVAEFPQLVVAQEVLTKARRRAGSVAPVPVKAVETGSDAFARLVREAELSAERGDAAGATLLLGRALELRPGDPLAQEPLVRLARQSGQPGPVSEVALAALRSAEELGDSGARADAYEQLARIDAELRGDPASALISWASALEADPKRYAVLRQLERAYLAGEQWSDLARLRGLELAHCEVEVPQGRADAVALALDRALLAERGGQDDDALRALFRAVVDLDPRSRLGLFNLEAIVRRKGSTPELADLEEKIAEWFADDEDAQAAFLTRAGETMIDLGELEAAVARFRRAAERVPSYAPALQGWRAAALKGSQWADVAEAAAREAEVTRDDDAKAALYHLAGVALMDRALLGDKALPLLQRALVANPRHHDAFLRVRILLEEDANHDDLATLLSHRLDVETDPRRRIELHHAVAELHRNFLDDRDTAKRHYRAILEADANDLRAIAAVSDICFELGQWAEAAEALMARAKLEQDPGILKNLFFRLGLIYADRIPDAPVAIKAFQRVLSYAPDDENALERLAELAMQAGEWKMALGACERLVKAESDPERRVKHLHRVARIFVDGMDDRKRAERALNLALDGAPASDAALSELIRFYQDAGDTQSTRVHLNRVAGAMRARIADDPHDGIAARVLSRAMTARHQAGVHGSRALARAGAELAQLAGVGGAPEQALIGEPIGRIDLAALGKPDADELLYPRAVPTELRQLLGLLGDRIAKHVGVDLRPYGVSRGDRLRAKDNLIAAAAQDLAASLGLGEIDVYLSTRQPWAMVAEPTSPVSLVLGAELARGEVDNVRFAAGGALKLAQSAMAIPFRLPPDELGTLVVGLLRIFQPEFPAESLEFEAITAQMQKLKRLIPSGLLNELRPYALAIDGPRFDHRQMAAGVRAAAYRAGLVCAGSLAAGLEVLAGRAGTDVGKSLDDPEARDLIVFAIGEDHAALAGG